MENKKYEHLLEVKDLYTSFNIPAGEVRSVNGVSFYVDKGKVLGIVGESGSGKSVTAYSIMQILQNPGRIVSGSIKFKGKELIGLPHSQLQSIRGDKIAIIFQDPMSSLNPVYTIGNQILEAIKLHPNKDIQKQLDDMISESKTIYHDYLKAYRLDKNNKELTKALKEAKELYKAAKAKKASYPHDRALEMLKLVGINEPEKRLKQYPFEFSGGMLQRIMIAMSLVCEPDLLIADEPTTALDVTIQAQILELLKSIQEKMNMGIIIITHDLGVVAQLCDYVNVMYAGRIVEKGTVQDIFYNPKHEYTKGLMNSIPQANDTRDRLEPIEGNPVDVFCLPKGCSFAPRCKSCMKICLKKYPAYLNVSKTHQTRCFKYLLELVKKGKADHPFVKKFYDESLMGNAAFKPISRFEVYDALEDYKHSKRKYLDNKDLVSQEVKEQLKFQKKEAKNNYKRSKSDLKATNKAKAFSRKEKPAMERADMAKKAKECKKAIRYGEDKVVNRKYLRDYLDNLNITSFPINLHFHREDVALAKRNYEHKKSFLDKIDNKDKLRKVHVLSEIDEAKRFYLDAQDNYEQSKSVVRKLFVTRKQLVRINTHRVMKTIYNNAKDVYNEFKGKHLVFTEKSELKEFLEKYKLTNFEINDSITLDELKIARERPYKMVDELRKMRSENKDNHSMHSFIKKIDEARIDYMVLKGEYQIAKFYKFIKPKFDKAISDINEKNKSKKRVIFREGGNNDEK